MIAESYDHLVSQVATALGVPVVRAFPNWARPDLAPPCAALEISELNPVRNRIGQSDAQHVLVLRLYVFADNEPQLGQMLDGVVTLKRTIMPVTVAGQRVFFTFSAGQRHPNQTGALQEDHGFSFGVTATYAE